MDLHLFVQNRSSVNRAVAPSLAGPAMAEPVFAAGAKILNIEDMHSKHTFKLGRGYWPKVKQRSKSRVVLLQCCRTYFEQGIARYLVL